MYQNCCKKCGSVSLHTETKGNNTGLYCDDCGAWIKWLGKDELRAFEHNMREATKEERDSVNRYIESISKPTGNTFTFTIKDRLERFVEGIDEAIDIEYEKLPITNCNIPMPNVKPPASNGDRICDTCDKEDVCMYKGELAQAAKEITQISERVNVFIDTDIRCKKWSGKVSNYRGFETR